MVLKPDISVLKDVSGKQETRVPSALSSMAAVLGHNICTQRGIVPCKRLKVVVPSR